MTPAIQLREFSVSLLDAEAEGVGKLCALLRASMPAQWPPQFVDAGVQAWFRSQIVGDPGRARWLGSYVLSDIDGARTLVGTAGFKGPPDDDGLVEIGYSLVETYHRRGIGTAVVHALVEAAFADPSVRKVLAETPTSFTASRRLLEKCGFQMMRTRSDPKDGDLACYEIIRA